MATIDPEELLRGALEKIVFFECRVSQLESELAATRQVAERARGDAAASRRRETELERAIADERGARDEAATRADELAERVRLLVTERERLLSGLVDRARLGGAPDSDGDAPDEGGSDLAGFIAELRAEIDDLRAFKAAAEAGNAGAAGRAAASGPRAEREAAVLARAERDEHEGRERAARVARMPRGDAPESMLRMAERFEAAGRVGFTARDADEMKAVLPTRSDRVLYERAMDELGAAEPGRRVRAARTLEALGSKTAAPLLAAALGREADGDVKAAFLGALAKFREPFAADLARRELADARPKVRVAALEALAAVAEGDALGALTGALGDASPVVRRRAVILLGFARGAAPVAALATALGDADAGVARAAAAALSGRPTAAAQNALARALEHADAGVRRSAAGALERWSDAPIAADAPAHERRRVARRIAERLAALSEAEVRTAVLATAALAPNALPRSSGSVPPSAPLTPTLSPRARSARAAWGAGGEGAGLRARVAVAVPEDAVPSRPVLPGAPLTPTASPRTLSAAPEGRGVEGSPRARSARAVESAGGEGVRAAVAVAEGTRTVARVAVAVVEEPVPAGLEEQVLSELRMALRGCASGDLERVLGAAPDRITTALHTLAARGAVALRGTRWFMA